MVKLVESSIEDSPFDFLDSWYGRRKDIEEDLEDHGYDILDSNEEYITVAPSDDWDDSQYALYLGGTPSTITIKHIEEVSI